MPEPVPPRVFLRPIGSPLTIGMSGLAIASLVQTGLDLHWVAASQTLTVGLILVSVPFLLQTIACILSYLARDGAVGAAVGVLAMSWLAIGLVHITSKPHARSGALGLMLLAAGAMLILSGGVAGAAKPVPASAFLLAGLRFLVAGVYELGAGGAWQDAAGIIGLVIVGVAGYSVLAFELEGELHRQVLPTFRIGVGRTFHGGDPERAIGELVDEPGVRQTT